MPCIHATLADIAQKQFLEIVKTQNKSFCYIVIGISTLELELIRSQA
jgi:hypothetical protein